MRQDLQDSQDGFSESKDLTGKIIGCAMKVHSVLGPGFLESVYQNAFTHELQKAGLFVECGKRIQVSYDGVVVGDFIADMVIQQIVLIENKAVQTLAMAHEVQLVNYLTATGIEIGLLLNFGGSRLQFKRKSRTYRPSRLERNPLAEPNFGSDRASSPHPVNPVHPVQKGSSVHSTEL